HGVEPDWILPANGSDENLTIIMRSFCDAGQQIGYPYPSYVLYESLARIQDVGVHRLLLRPDWTWDQSRAAELRRSVRIFFVPNPNSPTGTSWSTDQLLELLPDNGVLVLDQAYADFSE
ncbi:MAG: aminotransferase class I/II-fold pyridoxal phosphate-dependent enzyme, partial [Planctomyces sp.]